MTVRQGEHDRTWLRNERFQCENNRWYYLTREGSQKGPFNSHKDAERELLLFLRHAGDNLYTQDAQVAR